MRRRTAEQSERNSAISRQQLAVSTGVGKSRLLIEDRFLLRQGYGATSRLRRGYGTGRLRQRSGGPRRVVASEALDCRDQLIDIDRLG